ncbi:carboxypeptidase-like regulatory domain-containing protein [Polyangium jinanense]|uniref:Carboxypeptidase regulatory-like domain-containing protein n=1 Tax=Polyangium jinanense TaxID=2829994 RepID=A0A9X3XD11_9BACT|nr:carboxypeptidase-like regulatory domain-containing protein [Polyangium jinanense]MDC3960484.1 carboxypeptidase regulatory-like domain-containing protein [Polyangium jinanense]MDC3986743.1 carboxypeptidase regulatory-like domain-containing protein [Polyangium jinanense]
MNQKGRVMIGTRRRFAAAIIVLLVSSSAAAADLTLRGRIASQDKGQGIAELNVKLIPSQPKPAWVKVTSTANDGTYRFQDVPPGTYTLEVYRGATQLHSTTVTVDESGVKDVHIQDIQVAP